MSAPTSPSPPLSPTPTRTSAPVTTVSATARLDWRLRFAILSVVWGFSFLLIKVGAEAYAPFQVALGRVFFGTLVLLTVLLVRREPLPAAGAPGPT